MARRRERRRKPPAARPKPAAESRPLPARPVALALAALPVIAILAVLGPYLWPLDRAPSAEFSDIHHQHLPFLQTLAEGWRRDGELPRWNVQDFAGLPTVGDPQAGTYNPVSWLLSLTPSGHAFGMLIVGYAVLGALGFQLYARALGLTPEGGAAGAVVFTLGGALLLRLVVPGHVVFAPCFLLPWLLLTFECIAVVPRRATIAGAATLTGLLAVALAPQMLLYSVGLLAVLAAAIAARASRRTPTLLAFALVAILGGALAAVHLLPILALAGEFTRGHPAFASAARGLDEFAASPAWLAALVTGATPEEGLEWETHLYVGAVALALALLGLAAWPAGDTRRARAWLCGGLVVAILAFGLGPSAGLGPFRMPTRIFVLLPLPLAVLAGLGVDALVKRTPRHRTLVGVALIAALALDNGRIITPWVQTSPEETLAAPAPGVVLPASLASATRVAELERGAVSPGLPEPLVRRRGLETLAGSNPLIPWRFVLFASYAAGFEPFAHSFDIAVPLLDVEEPVLFDLIGVTHVLRPLSENPPRWQWDERPGALPRAYLAPAPTVVPEGAGDEQITREVQALARLAELDPRHAVLLHGAAAEEALARPGVAGAQAFEPFRAVPLVERHAHRLRVDVTLAAPGILVLNEPFFPGWRAWDGGTEIPIVRANVLFRALVLPPGEHALTLEFAPRAWTIGRGISLAALAVVLGLLLPWQRLTRRDRRT
jgi:hypothetical protein